MILPVRSLVLSFHFFLPAPLMPHSCCTWLPQRQPKPGLAPPPPPASTRASDEAASVSATAAATGRAAAGGAAAGEAAGPEAPPAAPPTGAEMFDNSSTSENATNAAPGREINEILVHNISHSDAIIALAAAVNGQPRRMHSYPAADGGSGSSNSSSSGSSSGSGSSSERGGGGLQGEVILARPKFFAFAPVTHALLNDAAAAATPGSDESGGQCSDSDGSNECSSNECSGSSDGNGSERCGTPRKVQLSYPTPVLTRDDQAPSHPLNLEGSRTSSDGNGVSDGTSSGSATHVSTAAERAHDAAAAARTFLPVGLRLDPPCCLTRDIVHAASANADQHQSDPDEGSAATAGEAAAATVASAVKRSLAPLANILSFRKDDFKLLQDAVLQ